MSSADLAIDYGTSNTVAVARGADGRPRQLLFDGSPLLPSAVYADPAEGMRTGRDAVRSARLEPARYEPNPKRRIDESEVLLGEQAFAVTDLIAHTLRTVRAEAVRVTGGPVGRVVVTHPVAWGRVRRRVLARACVEAGLPEPTLVAEPVAAAAYFARLPDVRLAPGQAVTVYDLGAGTFDVSVLARGANGFEPLGYQGLDDVGGLDLDGLVVAHAVSVVGRANPALWQRLTNPRDADDRRHHRLLWDDARFAKEALSRQHSATFPLALTGTDASITRAEFEALAQPMLARTVEVTAATIAQTGLAADRFAGLFLVGGGSRIPLVATLLHQRQRIAPTALEQPELAVAEGALTILEELPAVEAPTEPVAWPPAAAPVAAPAVMAPVAPPAVMAPPPGIAPVAPPPVEPAREPSFVAPVVPQPPRDRAVPLWPSGAAPAAPVAQARSSSWVLAWWLLPVLVLVPIAVLVGLPLVVGLAILAVALIGMLVHGVMRHRRPT